MTKIEQAVRNWVENIVVGLNLCPFAKKEMMKGSVRFIVSEADSEEKLLIDLHRELELLTYDETIETTLLIHPRVLNDFHLYNQFLSLADALLEQLLLDGIFQIASFHPEYQFAATAKDDVTNFTNRSPYPILHILREESLDIAIDTYPDVDQIPSRNIHLMREMGANKMKVLFQACLDRE